MGFTIKLLLCITFGYFIGCVNPAYILGRLRGFDIRTQGSGNAGATNAMILFGKPVGFCIAVVDVLKASVAWWTATAILPQLECIGPVAATACIFGHMFPVTMGFRGGKGFACLLGTALAYDPKALVTIISFALVTALLTRYLFIASSSTAVALPLYYWLKTSLITGTLILMLPIIPIWMKHRENFRRMREGREPRFSALWNKEKEQARIAAIEK